MPDKSLGLNILLFASLKERVGKNQIILHVDEECTVTDLRRELFLQYPELKPYSNSLIISVNQNFADPEQHIRTGDEIALFPPVSGG